MNTQKPTQRCQLFFRETGETFGDNKVHSFGGIFEAPKGAYDAQAVYQVAPQRGRDGGLSGFVVLPDKIPFENIKTPWGYSPLHDPQSASSVDYLLTSPIWPLSQVFNLGALQLRKIDIPSADPENEVFGIFGILAASDITPDYDSISVFEGPHEYAGFMDLQGRLGHEVLPERNIPPMVEHMRGDNFSALWRKPLWGFSDEPYMIPSFACEEEVNAWKEIAKRLASGDAPEDIPEEIWKWRSAGQTDEVFVAALTYLHEQYPDHIDTAYVPKTAAQSEEIEQRMSEAISHVLSSPRM
ncbi:hypothetical protein [Salipiger sp. PrR003]|uniref:hypothetical protein n=1 Tax=Salipiger sp. PrR003 TaxID=2706776 RepID=UPI0013DB1052|nr:hypothetical protein [Salipiger sp. PrR003]NDV50145.1 hypothetical protein [Salipiger sp. PrR003]